MGAQAIKVTEVTVGWAYGGWAQEREIMVRGSVASNRGSICV